MSRICRQCPEPVGDRAPSAYLCIKCALANTRPKRWTLRQLQESSEIWWCDDDWYCPRHGNHGECQTQCFLDWLKAQA